MDTPLASFFLGGFESATHRRADRRQLDLIEGTRHDLYAAEDFRLLQQVGIYTVRDGLRWHLIEQQPGVYDWSSFRPMLQASIDTGTEVIWDLCHWGLPADLDIFSPAFIDRFAAFARAAVLLINRETDAVPLFCPVNEISFWAWVGADVGAFYPHVLRRGPDLKRQLVKATLAAVRAIREVDPRARFIQPEPLINVVAHTSKPEDSTAAARHTALQYEAWDWLAASEPGNSGLDILGINYYWDNQWVHGGERTAFGHFQHRPLHHMLLEAYARYARPLLITETGAESDAAAGWLAYICAEIRQAQRGGASILGICLYPVMDYPGWDDGRHCHCGLVEVEENWHRRHIRESLASELRLQQRLFAASGK